MVLRNDGGGEDLKAAALGFAAALGLGVWGMGWGGGGSK
jgi:hypothetical protein